MTTNGRKSDGTFSNGNPGGPGRPRRAVEHDYLVALADACPPDVWAKIVAKAVGAAVAGDPKSREWLARYLIGAEPPKLIDLAAIEHDGGGIESDIASKAADRRRAAVFDRIFDTPSNVGANQ